MILRPLQMMPATGLASTDTWTHQNPTVWQNKPQINAWGGPAPGCRLEGSYGSIAPCARYDPTSYPTPKIEPCPSSTQKYSGSTHTSITPRKRGFHRDQINAPKLPRKSTRWLCPAGTLGANVRVFPYSTC